MLLLGFIISIFSRISLNTHYCAAEYRTFELRIDDTIKNKSRTVTGTLDHLQYPRYFPLQKGEVAVYVDSWMCKGNTSNFKPTCKKPEPLTPLATQAPSSPNPSPVAATETKP